mmetsp:Transcript_31135/g.71743  ORF Transcript_31135/g.71743 Transcript_31135/m.71743 type:complete len:132 (+) Transcript_31135:498-893(+)
MKMSKCEAGIDGVAPQSASHLLLYDYWQQVLPTRAKNDPGNNFTNSVRGMTRMIRTQTGHPDNESSTEYYIITLILHRRLEVELKAVALPRREWLNVLHIVIVVAVFAWLCPSFCSFQHGYSSIRSGHSSR